MKLQQYLLNDYLHIPFENFSHKAVAAVGILTTINNSPLSDLSKIQKEEIVKSIEKVKEIISSTRKDIQVSLFVLDRNIIPQDIAKSSTNYMTKFARDKNVKDNSTIQLNQDQIQKLLCEAQMEIHEILMRQVSGFSEQMFFDGDSSL